MPFIWRSISLRQRTTVVAATGNPQVLAALWGQPGVRVREARSADGLNDLLGEARLVILDAADVVAGSLDVSYLAAALVRGQVPQTDSAGFLADPPRWLAAADAFAGHIRSLPPRLVACTSLASGGVGKTTLTVGLALNVARRTQLPVAIVELSQGASGFLAVLDGTGFTTPPADAYAIATQDAEPGVWRGLTVAPLDGRQASLLTGESLAALLAQLRAGHVLVVVDASQPHPLWPAVDAAADAIFVVAAADRPDTITNAQAVLAEGNDPRRRLVLNFAGKLDRVATRLAQAEQHVITIPRRAAIARFTEPLPALTAALWPGVRL